MRRSTFVKNELDLIGLLDSLRTFRGILYDGVLQPNVRPAIGIEFCIDPLPEFLSLRFTTGPEGIGLTQGA